MTTISTQDHAGVASFTVLSIRRGAPMQLEKAVRQYDLFVGIDVSADSVTMAWRDGDGKPSNPITVVQSSGGYLKLRGHLGAVAVGVMPERTLVVMEATGVYWIALANALVEFGFVVSVVNSLRAHHFAKAVLRRRKTDDLDAQMLAELAARLQPAPWTPPPLIAVDLQQLLMMREGLIRMRTQIRNQMSAIDRLPHVNALVQSQLAENLARLKDNILTIEQNLATTVQRDPVWAAASRRLQTIKGIGPMTAYHILTSTLCFTKCQTPEEAASYAGLVLREHQSGTSVNKQVSGHLDGSRRLRTALYMATMPALRFNPVIRRFYQRLRDAGKPARIARCAVARKLLHIAFAVVTKQQDFDPEYEAKLATRSSASA